MEVEVVTALTSLSVFSEVAAENSDLVEDNVSDAKLAKLHKGFFPDVVDLNYDVKIHQPTL